MSYEIDAAVIGTGQAGPALATALAGRGETVAVFEGGSIGGSCVNVGCTPTKTLRKSARIAHLARRSHEFGVHTGEVHVDFPAAMQRVRDVVSQSSTGLTAWLEGTDHLTLVRGYARLDGRVGDGVTGRFVVRAGDQTFHAARVYLNVGTRPSVPPIPGLADATPLTNESLLQLDALPAHLVIIGGSYIGLEFAQIFRRLGSAVTVIEAATAVASREDADVSASVAASLEAEGVVLFTGARIAGVVRRGHGVEVSVIPAGSDTPLTIAGSHLLAATGRTPNTAGLGLESVGVTCDARGYVPVDGGLATNVPGIWALGDVNRRGAFTHTSWQDHEIVLANHTGGKRTVDGRVTTYALFTDPPLGRIGMSERDARAAMADGRRFLMAKIDMANVSRAKEESETTGFIKVLVDADSGRFAGVAMHGIGADEIVQVIGAQMAAGATYDVLRNALPIHPTVTEFFPTILGRLEPLVADGTGRGA